MKRRHSFKAQFKNELIEFKTHDGADYIVAPCIAIVPGVLNGALIPLHVIEDTYRAWNGRPIVVDHPSDTDGIPISANDPNVIEQSGIGQIWYANTADDRLKVEAWVNTAKADLLGGNSALLVQRLSNKEAIEVSTGFWGVTHEQEGTFNDDVYQEVTDLIIPDHLAFLPNSVGACNWGDGCGVPRFNSEVKPKDGDRALENTTQLELTLTDDDTIMSNMTVTDQFAILSGLIAKEMEEDGNTDFWRWHVVDIEDLMVIMMFDGKLMRRAFVVTEADDIELMGEWEEVNRKTTFTPAAAEGQCQCGGRLQTKGDATVAEQETVDTLDVFLKEQGVTGAEVLVALSNHKKIRSEAIDTILKTLEMEREELETLSDKALQTLAKAASVDAKEDVIEPTQNTHEPADFSGRGAPAKPPVRETVPERPSVLKSVGNRPNTKKLLGDDKVA